MKRRTRFLLNIILVACAVEVAILLLTGADRLAERILMPRLWPGPIGLIFNPHNQDSVEMHDYQCTETINTLGLRDNEIPVHTTHALRIAAIGDSFTYGWGVNLENAWCKVLERNLREKGLDVEMVNLGRPAAGPFQYAAIAETAIPVLQPDLVLVVLLAGDDINQVWDQPDWKAEIRYRFPNLVRSLLYLSHREIWSTPHPPFVRNAMAVREQYKQTAQDVLGKFTPEERACFDTLGQDVKDAFFGGTLNPWMIGHSISSPNYFIDSSTDIDSLDVHISLMTKAFSRIRNAATRYGARVITMTIPEGFYVNEEAYTNVQRIGFRVVPALKTTTVQDDAVKQASEHARLPFFAVTSEYRQHKDEKGLYFEFDRHMTAAGNKLYADLVTPTITKEVENLLQQRKNTK